MPSRCTNTFDHKLRPQILKVIAAKKETKVNETYKHRNIEQSVASQHLAILLKAGFVRTERSGKQIFTPSITSG